MKALLTILSAPITAIGYVLGTLLSRRLRAPSELILNLAGFLALAFAFSLKRNWGGNAKPFLVEWLPAILLVSLVARLTLFVVTRWEQRSGR